MTKEYDKRGRKFNQGELTMGAWSENESECLESLDKLSRHFLITAPIWPYKLSHLIPSNHLDLLYAYSSK